MLVIRLVSCYGDPGMADKPNNHSATKRSNKRFYEFGGLTQHCFVEHALCPLDKRRSLTDGVINEYTYFFQDKNRNKKKAKVQVACPFGLSPNDEFYLWGLLNLTFSQDEPSQEFIATPHYCLRQLGVVDAKSNQQKRYDTFRQAIQRLSGVAYQNDRFYDPIRGEHRDVGFGLIKYSLPIDPGSSRAWRFVWDQQFFEFCQSMRGSFQFDLDLYRDLDFASRRLFLFLKKLFWRRDTVQLDVSHLAINVLGFSPSIPVADVKVKLTRCVNKLIGNRLLAPFPHESTTRTLFVKRGPANYEITLRRGAYFEEPIQFSRRAALKDSPLYDPLKAIGFTDHAITQIVSRYRPSMIGQWTDITLAAIDRKIINKDPKAYFNYYIAKAAKKETTPPDWWRNLRKQEEKQNWEEQRANSPIVAGALTASTDFDEAFNVYLEDEARQTFEQVSADLLRQFTSAVRPSDEAKEAANRFARQHMRNRFLDDHPEFREAA